MLTFLVFALYLKNWYFDLSGLQIPRYYIINPIFDIGLSTLYADHELIMYKTNQILRILNS